MKLFKTRDGVLINIAQIVKITPVPERGSSDERFALATLVTGETVTITKTDFEAIQNV